MGCGCHNTWESLVSESGAINVLPDGCSMGGVHACWIEVEELISLTPGFLAVGERMLVVPAG